MPDHMYFSDYYLVMQGALVKALKAKEKKDKEGFALGKAAFFKFFEKLKTDHQRGCIQCYLAGPPRWMLRLQSRRGFGFVKDVIKWCKQNGLADGNLSLWLDSDYSSYDWKPDFKALQEEINRFFSNPIVQAKLQV